MASARVLYVMAAEAEYGARLRARIKPLVTGVGPVEAAISTTMALFAHEAAGETPDLVVSLGSAGSATLEQGTIYQVSSVSWRDMDATALGFEPGVTPFLDEIAEVRLPTPIEGVATARLSTGSNIVSGAAYGAVDADMVDMETHAVRRACARFGVPMIGLRGVSDGKEALTGMGDWTRLLAEIDEGLAATVDKLEQGIVRGAIRLPDLRAAMGPRG